VSAPLYQRLLGEDFERLPPVMRAFHTSARGGSADAIMRVERGRGLLHRIAGWLGRLPEAGEHVHTSVEVRVERDRERWIRSFEGTRVESVQWAEGDLFVERSGPLAFVFELELDPEGVLHFRLARVRFFGIPLPRFLAPSAISTVVPDREGWQVEVEMRAPILGTVLRYEGVVRPRS
jgi:hypothetical protein